MARTGTASLDIPRSVGSQDQTAPFPSAPLSAKRRPSSTALRRMFSALGQWVDVWWARRFNRTPHVLPALILMVTDKCNLKCKMCGACDYSPGDHNMLTLEEWKGVLDAAARLGTRLVSITGGEALLRKDLFALIAYARGLGMSVHLNTNGLLLNEPHVQALVTSGVDTVSISLDGPDAATHDAVRGPGTFERTLKGIRTLRRLGPGIRVGINYVLHRANYEAAPRMVDLALEEGVDQLKFAPIHTNLQHKDKPLSAYGEMIFMEEDLPRLERVAHGLYRALRSKGLHSSPRRFFYGMRRLYESPPKNFYCFAGYAICVVNPQGYVSACFDKPSSLNVREQPLDVLWRSEAFQRHRQLVRRCDKACWDTTNAELSMQLQWHHWLRYPRETLRTLWYYYFPARAKRRG